MFKTNLLIFITFLLAFLYGALQMSLLLPQVQDIEWLNTWLPQVWAAFAAEDTWYQMGVYIAFMILPPLTFLMCLMERRKKRSDFTIQTENGRITITTVAMRKFIRCVCSAVPGIDHCGVNIQRRRKKLDARVVVKVNTPDAWLTVKHDLLERIPQAVSQVMGADVIGSLEVVCQDLSTVKLAEDPQDDTPTIVGPPTRTNAGELEGSEDRL